MKLVDRRSKPTGRWLITLHGSKRVFVVYAPTFDDVEERFRETWPTLGLPGLEVAAPKTLQDALAAGSVWVGRKEP